MMNPQELRGALTWREEFETDILIAARAYLAILEGDEGLVERIALTIHNFEYRQPRTTRSESIRAHLGAARAVLATLAERQP